MGRREHDHHVHGGASDARTTTALLLLAGFFVLELGAAVLARSTALLADAAHMLTDIGSLCGALFAMRLARRPPTVSLSYGLQRAEIIAAAANGLLLALLAVALLYQAVSRLIHPVAVNGPYMVWVALAGVVVNVAASAVLAGADRSSLNMEAAFRHVQTDLFAFSATVVAGAVVWASGIRSADPVASLVVVALMARTAASLLGPSVRILMEAVPEGIELETVRRHLLSIPEVRSVHDLHAWTLTSHVPVLSAHVVVDEQCLNDGTSSSILDKLQSCLVGHFDVAHSTFQIEPTGHAQHEAPSCQL